MSALPILLAGSFLVFLLLPALPVAIVAAVVVVVLAAVHGARERS